MRRDVQWVPGDTQGGAEWAASEAEGHLQPPGQRGARPWGLRDGRRHRGLRVLVPHGAAPAGVPPLGVPTSHGKGRAPRKGSITLDSLRVPLDT